MSSISANNYTDWS